MTRISDAPFDSCRINDFMGIIHEDDSMRLLRVSRVDESGPTHVRASSGSPNEYAIEDLKARGRLFAITNERVHIVHGLWDRDKVIHKTFWNFQSVIGSLHKKSQLGNAPRSAETDYSIPTASVAQPKPQNAPTPVLAPRPFDLESHNRIAKDIMDAKRSDTDDLEVRLVAVYDTHVMLGDEPHEAFDKAIKWYDEVEL